MVAPARLLGSLVAEQSVLQTELFLFQPCQQVRVRVGAMLLGIDLRMKRGMFGCDCLDLAFVHRSISFRWLTRDKRK